MERMQCRVSFAPFCTTSVSAKKSLHSNSLFPAFGGRLQEDDINNVASYVIAKSDAGWESDSTASAVVQTVELVPAADKGKRVGGDVLSGEQIFVNNCAACHSGGQNVIMPEKTLEKDALDKYLAGGRNKDSVITQVTNGKNAMPAFGGRLSEFDIEDVASYVISTSETGWK